MENFEFFGVPILKKGSGIHIKKKNRGKFTEYCGGKVTDECIRRGKNSSDPKIRKRATFAANSRKWKHEKGAKIHQPYGHRSILDNGWISTKELKKKHKLVGYNQAGGLVNQQYSGTWGNRGQGNELQSALENGLSWVGDKVLNAGNYIEDGLSYLVGFLPGNGLTPEQMVANNRLERESDGVYQDVNGNLQVSPIALKAPMLPTLPANATPAMQALFGDLKRARYNWQVRESQLRKLGREAEMESTGTAKVYRGLEKALSDLINNAKGSTKPANKVKLNRKQNAEFRNSKYMSSEAQGTVGDLRTVTSGRSALKGRQWDEVERFMRTDKDPKVISMLNQYDIKVAKGINPVALKQARMKMLQDYLNMRPGYFNHLRQ